MTNMYVGPMGRTTLRIDDELLRRLKERAAREGRTLQDVTNEVLRHGLRRVERPADDFSLRLEGWEAEPRPGVDLRDRDALLELMEGRE